MPGPVESAIRRSITPGMTLHTPSRRAPFVVVAIDREGVVLLMGVGQWPTRLTWECLEGIVPYLRDHGGEVMIGGQHTVVGRPGTLDAYLKACVSRTTAGWVASMLTTAGILELVDDRPARVRLGRS